MSTFQRYILMASCYERSAHLHVVARSENEARREFVSRFSVEMGSMWSDVMWPLTVTNIDTDRPDMARFWQGHAYWSAS